MPNFETFTRRMVPLSHEPSVTIQKAGTISLNKSAHAAMGEPDYVELLFDAGNQVVGFRPSDSHSPHAYPLRPQRKDVGPYMVAGTAFTKYYGIDTTVSRRWVAEVVDGVLCADLTKDCAIVTSNRSGRGSSDNAGPDETSPG